VELPGSLYLYAIATVSITFVGFSAMLVVFRQSMGGQLTRYDTYFTLSFIQAGFVVTAGALVPPAVALYSVSPDAAWRIAGGIVAILVFMFVARVPGRRRAATGQSMPPQITTMLTLQALSGVSLVLGSAGFYGTTVGAAYVSAIAVLLITSGAAYLGALALILPDLTTGK
jgi:archaellum biogenesis protein FlaJ (TadC family)